jgi:hypothetical protein
MEFSESHRFLPTLLLYQLVRYKEVDDEFKVHKKGVTARHRLEKSYKKKKEEEVKRVVR